jgi:suppressor of G2 allele of SKP1
MAADGWTPKYDWYQTPSDVCLNLLVKEDVRKEFNINFEPTNVSIYLALTNGSACNLKLDLAEEIVPESCSFKKLKSKIEVKLRKKVGTSWKTLEKTASTQTEPKQSLNTDTTEDTSVNKYPSSSHYTRNWDKLVGDIKKDEENEKPEGDAALNQLFQQIYSGGNDEVKKAMNKSFVESGGTVLSTNWDEVGQKKVEMKTPDGMEYKKYEI